MKTSDVFHISAQNIDGGYALEPPRRGGSNAYNVPTIYVLGRNMKNNIYPCKPRFYYIKGSKLYRHVFVMSVCLWFHMWRLWCPYLLLISPSIGTPVGLCSVILAFPAYLHLYFFFKVYQVTLRRCRNEIVATLCVKWVKFQPVRMFRVIIPSLEWN